MKKLKRSIRGFGQLPAPWAVLWLVVGVLGFSVIVALVDVSISAATGVDINTVLKWTFRVLNYTLYIFLVFAASYGFKKWLDEGRG